MKIILSIFLLLTTAFYILPVKEMISSGNDICYADMDEYKEECNKKEKTKELFLFNKTYSIPQHRHCTLNFSYHLSVPVVLHTVETPPPDFV